MSAPLDFETALRWDMPIPAREVIARIDDEVENRAELLQDHAEEEYDRGYAEGYAAGKAAAIAAITEI